MASRPGLGNRVRVTRLRHGWSQDELAKRSGLSRAGVSAIENGRLVPSTTAALALASAFEGKVEDLFHLSDPKRSANSTWAWPPSRSPVRYWSANFRDGQKRFPVEATPLGVIPHDGVGGEGPLERTECEIAGRTLVLASCDPAVGLLAHELERAAKIRLIVIPRPSRQALALVASGLVHAAGVHLARPDGNLGNAEAVRESIGDGYVLLRVARWDEGIAVAPGRRLTSVREALRAKLQWVGREEGSGARQCQDELLGDEAPSRLATDHRGVAEAVRHGWAEAGICLRLASEEAGLDFLGVRQEAYDLCLPSNWKADPRLTALVGVVRSPAYHRALGDLPGYEPVGAGEIRRV